jgi:hypothetical protein
MIRKASPGIWCDYCKITHGKDKSGQWKEKAKTQADWTIEKTLKKSNADRHLCSTCAYGVSYDGTFTIWDQVKSVQPIQGSLNV